MKPAKFTTRQRLSLAAICVAYPAVRFWDLTASCLWFDEIFSVHAAEYAWGGMIWFIARDIIHPPLFYAVLKLWIALGGESLFWLRLLPVLFSVFALVPFLYLCRELKLKFSTTALALAFLGVNGALVKYAQEVRMYSLLLFLSLVSMWLFSRFFYRGKNIWILTFVNILLVFTHYFGWFVLVSETLIVLAFQRIKIRHVVVMWAAVVVGYIPWLAAIWKAGSLASDVHQNLGWIERPLLGSLFSFLFDAVEPFYYQQSSADPPSLLYISIPLVAVVAAAKTAYIYRFKGSEDKSGVYLLSIFAAVPIFLALLLSWTMPVSVWGSRHLIIVFPPILILAAVFVTEIANRVLQLLALSLIVIVIAAAFTIRARTEPAAYIWCAWEKLAPSAGGGDTIYAFEDLVAYHLWFATRNQSGPRITKVNNMPGVIEDTAYFLPRGFDGVQTIDAGEISGERFWTAFRDEAFDPQQAPLRFLLDRDYKIGQKLSLSAQRQQAFLIELKK